MEKSRSVRSKGRRKRPRASEDNLDRGAYRQRLNEPSRPFSHVLQELETLLSAEECKGKTEGKGNLAEFFTSSPLRGSRLRARRSTHKIRDIDL
jgi:hypothetical protein